MTHSSLERSTPPPRRWSLVIGLILVLGGVWFIWSRGFLERNWTGSSNTGLEPVALVGQPAPDFALATLEGETLSLKDLKGKPVLINFWATWCVPCRKEFPELQAVWVEQADELVIIGINHTSADTPDLVPGFVEEMGITFPVVLDESGETLEAYQIRGMPTSIFIDREGIVQEVFLGPLDQAGIKSRMAGL